MRKRGDGEAERCESGCSEPVAHHDVEGVPLCQACWDELIAAGPDAYEDTPEEAAVLVGETVVVPTAVPPGSGEAPATPEVPQGPGEATGLAAARLQAHVEGRAEGLREAREAVQAYAAALDRPDLSQFARMAASECARRIERLAAHPPQPLACACVETRYHGGKCSARPDDGARACASCIEYEHDVSAPAKETP